MIRRWRSLTLAAGLCLGGCHHGTHEAGELGKLQVTRPVRQSTELSREFVAQVHAIRHIEIRALERGYLEETLVDEGQAVQSGQKLFQLMPRIHQAEVQKAEAEAKRTELEFKNTSALAEKAIVSPNELALSQADLAKAKAQLLLANTHRGFTAIHAPFNGIMGRFEARLGSLIDEGDLLTTLSDTSAMWVYFNVAESEYLELRGTSEVSALAPVRLRLANGALFEEPGKIETIAADFNNETGTIAFRATFPNPKGLLRHGQTGTVVMRDVIEDALVIPQIATFDVLDQKFVFVVDAKNVVHSRPITVKAEKAQLYVVESGLEPDDQILLEGLRKVHDGSTIEPSFQQPEAVFAHLEVPAE